MPKCAKGDKVVHGKGKSKRQAKTSKSLKTGRAPKKKG